MSRRRTVLALLFILLGSAALPAQQPTFLYSVHGISNDVWAYTMDPSTGTLTKIGAFPVGVIAHGIAVDPTRRFAYVANANSNSISGFVINPSNGNLIAVPGSPFAAGTSPHAVIVDPTGKYAYASNLASGNISAYAVNAQTGTLTPITGSPFASADGRNGFSVAADPTGHHLYVPNIDGGSVSGYSIDNATGVLTPIPGSPFTAGTSSTAVAIHPSGQFAYVSESGAALHAFGIDPTTGGLTPVPGSPFPCEQSGRAITIDPNGRFVYVASENLNSVTGFSVNPASGVLTRITGSPYAVGHNPAALTVDPTSHFLYVGNALSDNISAFRINQSTGQLVQIAGSPFLSGQEPLFFAFATPAVAPQLGIQFVEPTHGGNAGTVTMQIIGSGFQSGATVKLTGVGPDILGTNTTVPNASVLTTTFNLTGATPGVRNVVVTNLDNTTTTLTGGFTVEQGGAAQLWVNIIGRDKIRIGAQQQYYAVLQNRGTIDSGNAGLIAVTVPSRISVSPAADPMYEFAGKRSLSGPNISSVTKASFSGAAISTSDLLTTALWAIPSIGAGSTWLVPFSLNVVSGTTDIGSFLLSARWNSNTNLPDPSKVPIETYVQAVGCPAPDYSRHCINCFAEAQTMGNEFADATLAYSGISSGSADFTIALTEIAQDMANVAGATLGTKTILAGLSALTKSTVDYQLAETTIESALDLSASELGQLNPDSSPSDLLCPFTATATKAFAEYMPTLLATVGVNDPSKLQALTEQYNKTLIALRIGVAILCGLPKLIDARTRQAEAFASFGGKLQLYCQARQAYLNCLDNKCGGHPAPPPDPSSTDVSQLNISPVASLDPNDKSGSRGAGDGRYISLGARTEYAVYFENQPTATAPAQTVTMTDTLNASLDLNTITLGPIAFPNQVVMPPSIPLSVAPFTTTVDLRPAKYVLVKINASLNTSTGVMTWTFQSLDPATGLPPTDPLVGFLPPGAEGSVFFMVMPKAGIATGTGIQNKATIVFDVNPALDTATWSNTIDSTKPTSSVSPPASRQMSYTFPVQWAGTDVGSGVQDFTIYVSDNGGPFTPRLTNTTATQADYTGVGGHTYSFYSIARDLVGNVENGKSTADATTRVILDTTPPVITPQVTGTLGDNGRYKSNVTVTWTVTDPESGIASASGCGTTTLTTETPGVMLTCSATNGAGLSNSASITIKIDTTVPAIVGMPTAGCSLWPPNHKLVKVATVSASDALSGLASFNVTATSNEPLDPKDPAIVISGTGLQPRVVELQAERLGNGTGRIYTLNATATDLAGNTASSTATCVVPHDQGK